MSAILAALKAFVVGTVPLNVAIKVAFATLTVAIYCLGLVCSFESICVFIPNTTRYVKGTFIAKDLLLIGEERKNLSKELLGNGCSFTWSRAGLKELGHVMLKTWARNAISKVDKSSGSLVFGSLAVVKGGGNSLFEGLKGVHSSVKCCVNAFNFFSNLRSLKRSFSKAFICFDVDVRIFSASFIEEIIAVSCIVHPGAELFDSEHWWH